MQLFFLFLVVLLCVDSVVVFEGQEYIETEMWMLLFNLKPFEVKQVDLTHLTFADLPFITTNFLQHATKAQLEIIDKMQQASTQQKLIPIAVASEAAKAKSIRFLPQPRNKAAVATNIKSKNRLQEAPMSKSTRDSSGNVIPYTGTLEFRQRKYRQEYRLSPLKVLERAAGVVQDTFDLDENCSAIFADVVQLYRIQMRDHYGYKNSFRKRCEQIAATIKPFFMQIKPAAWSALGVRPELISKLEEFEFHKQAKLQEYNRVMGI